MPNLIKLDREIKVSCELCHQTLLPRMINGVLYFTCVTQYCDDYWITSNIVHKIVITKLFIQNGGG